MAEKKHIGCKIQTGDCIKLLKKFDPNTVALAFCDPPFGIDWKGYTVYDDALKGSPYVEWCKTWMTLLYRAIKKHGSFWLAIGDEHVSELDVAAKAIGFHKRSHVVWYVTFGVACSKNFSRSHTHLLYYTKHKTKFTFNADEIRVPSARQLVYNDHRANREGKLPDNTWILSPRDLSKAFTPDEDTWIASRLCGTFHEREQRGEYQKKSTVPQMPLAVVERAVKACSNPGDFVIDPFLGNGTTAEAAVANGRHFWGCDISAAETAISRRRAKRAMK